MGVLWTKLCRVCGRVFVPLRQFCMSLQFFIFQYLMECTNYEQNRQDILKMALELSYMGSFPQLFHTGYQKAW
jgi:hypothetical protein